MIIDVAELERILETFEGTELAHLVASARRLSRLPGVEITKSSTVPASNLWKIYSHRAQNPRSREAVRSQSDRIAKTAARFPDERWHIVIVIAGELQVDIFCNESGQGRAAIDFTLDGK